MKIKNTFKYFGLLLFLSLGATSLFAQQKERVLFIGNSFTYYWNLPKVVEEMATSKGLNWEVYQATLPAATLEQHWKGERKLRTKKLISRKKFDKIILQDQSANPLKNTANSNRYIANFIDHPKAQNAQFYLFSTWLYPKIIEPYPESPYPIEKVMSDIAQKNRAKVLQVGRAFAQFQKRYPSFKLLSDDQKHPSPNGTYLAACVIFGKLSGQSPMGLPHRIKVEDKKEHKTLYYMMVENKVAEACQEIAARILGF